MKIYEVIEYLREGHEENASGMYSSFEKAQQAILKRVAEVYTPEEMTSFKFSDDGSVYLTESNDWVNGCVYMIFEYELDKEII